MANYIIVFLHTKIFHTMDSKNIVEIFGINVQKYRKEKQISQEKLAELAGVHRTYIGMIERAEKNITLRNMEKIAKALNVEIKDLLEK
jgi:transcriptional regulator with XRE-family HTH domain